jgi:two-component SAPR family response regulator
MKRMRVLVIDSSTKDRDSLEKIIRKVVPENELDIKLCDCAEIALDHIVYNLVDVVFLEIEIPDMNGIQVGSIINEIHPMANIIYATNTSDYALEAIRTRCSGYIVKSNSFEDRVKEEIKNLRHPVVPTKDRVFAQTFGHFELFVDGRALKFASEKSKEILAYLIDRKGSVMKNVEIADVVWSNNTNTTSLRTQFAKAKSKLMKALRNAGIEDVLKVTRTSLGIDVSNLRCDYYQLLEDNVRAKSLFVDEYMTEYDWGEVTLATLMDKYSN